MSLPQDLTCLSVVCEQCGRKTSFQDGSLIAVHKPPPPRDPNAPLRELELLSVVDLEVEEPRGSYVRHREERLLAAKDGSRWLIACTECSTSRVYWVDLENLFAGGGPTISWIHHLAAKPWFHAASFVAAVARLCDQLYVESGRRATEERARGGAA